MTGAIADVAWDLSPEFCISQAQADFICDETHLYPGLVSGFGGGKTFAGAYKSFDHSLCHPKGNRGLLIAPTYALMKDIMWPKIFDEILDPAGVPYKLYRTIPYHVRFPWGGQFDFKSGEHPHKIVGTEHCYVWLDEPQLMKRLCWSNAISRVRSQSDYIRQRFVTFTPEVPGWTHELWGPRATHDNPRYKTYLGSSYDNWMLPDDYIPELLAEWSTDDAQSRVHGHFYVNVSGRIYGSFTRKNIAPVVYDPRKPLWFMFDFNEVPGMHVGVGQADKDADRFTVVSEIHKNRLRLEDSCVVALKRYARTQIAPVFICGDAQGVHSASRRSYYAIIEDIFKRGSQKVDPFRCGIMRRTPRANPSVADSAAAVNAALCDARGARHLTIDPSCARLVIDLEQVISTQEKARQLNKLIPPKFEIDKTDPRLTHISDALRYWIALVRPVRTSFQRQPGRAI